MTEHLPIQRWTKIFTRYPASEVLPNENGEYVTYADHLAALRACEQIDRGYLRGYVDGLDDAREAVLGAKAIDVYYGRGLDEPPQFVWLNNALSAIDALREELHD